MTFILTILVVWLLFSLFSLQGRVDQLEQMMQTKQPVRTQKTKTIPVQTAAPTVTKPIIKKTTPTMSLEDLLTKRVFPVLGSLSLILAVAYFVVMAINNDWIGPVAQILLAALASGVFLFLGEMTRHKYPNLFGYLSAVGVAGLIMTTFAAQSFYGLITPLESLVIYCAEVALGVWLSLRYDRRELANLAILGGLLAPVLTQAPDPNTLGLMCFLAILALAGFVVSIYKRWPELLVLLLLGIVAYEFVLAATEAFVDTPLLYLGLIYAIHALLGSGGFVRQRLGEEDPLDMVVLIGSVVLANFLGYNIFEGQGWDYFGIFVLLQGAGFAGLAYWSYLQGWEIYQRLCTFGALLSIVFATLWELQAAENLLLTGVFAAESLALAWGAVRCRDTLFNAFSLLVAGFALIFAAQVDGIWWSLLGLVMSGLAVFGSAHAWKDPEVSEPLKGIAAVLVGGAVWLWSFEYLADWTELMGWPIVAYYLALCAVPLALMAASRYPGAQIYAWVSLAFLALVNLGGLAEYTPAITESLSLLGLFLLVGSAVGYLAYTDKNLPEVFQKSAGWLVLVAAFLHLITFGVETLEEPMRTVFWLVTGVGALFVGLQKDWINLRYAGLGMMLLVIAKLYVFDVWHWDLWARFMAFSALGVALLATAFYVQYLNKK